MNKNGQDATKNADEVPVYPRSISLSVFAAVSLTAFLWSYTNWERATATELVVIWLLCPVLSFAAYGLLTLLRKY